MSEIIRKPQEEITALKDKLKQEFATYIDGLSLSDGKVSFIRQYAPEKSDRKAKLFCTERAWLKMQALVSEFDKEVAWHSVAKRGENQDEYIIEDVVVYPQIVTGADVDTDDAAYASWLYGFENDIFNNLRMQGHSHVRMGVTPSAVDTGYWNTLLKQVEDPEAPNRFYIFMILNKQGDKTIRIYDFEQNILFNTADVDLILRREEGGLYKFIEEAKEVVKDKTYRTPTYAGGYTGTGYWQHGYYMPTAAPAAAPQKQTLTVIGGGAAPAKEKGKGKGKKQNKKNGRPGAGWGTAADHAWSDTDDSLEDYYASLYSDAYSSAQQGTVTEDDDENDPTSPFFYSERWDGFNAT